MNAHTGNLRLFLKYVLVLPIGVIAGLYTYSLHPQYSNVTTLLAPLPMVLILAATHIASIVFLVSRPTRFSDNHFAVTFLSLFTAFFLCILIFFLLRTHYSLSFLIVFLPLVWLWIFFCEHRRNDDLRQQRYALVMLGEWDQIFPPNAIIAKVSQPSELDSIDYEVLLIDEHAVLPREWQQFLPRLISSDKDVMNIGEFIEGVYGWISVEHCSSDQFSVGPSKQFYHLFKRFFDIVVSLIALIILSPLIFVVILLIKLETKGPPIYRQSRVGRGNHTFVLFKLRTMYQDSEQSGPVFAQADDPRVTKIGRWLRRARIDEWPQFVNVLKGEMSLVGPRPERPEWVEQFQKSIPYYDLRLLVRPGITGWAQVTHGYTTGEQGAKTKLLRDLYYVKHLGFQLDTIILFRTFSVLGRKIE